MSFIIRPPQGNMSYSQPPKTVKLSTTAQSDEVNAFPRFMDNVALLTAIVNVERPPQPTLARPLSEALPRMAELFELTYDHNTEHTLDILPSAVDAEHKSGWRVQVTRRGPYYDSAHLVDGYYKWTLQVWIIAPYSVVLVKDEHFRGVYTTKTPYPTFPDQYYMPYHENKTGRRAGDIWGHSLEDIFALTQDVHRWGLRSTSVGDIIIDVDANMSRVAPFGFEALHNVVTGENT
tara:strand:+ start:553 stop:1254 length:702 start_codon:yes stop_codon:yes gene_type:complete